ncbi:MAG: hypothetical protein ACLP7P_00305 [Rhodomicrobium sp.]
MSLGFGILTGKSGRIAVDPAMPGSVGAKMGVDAAEPLDASEGRRSICVPGEDRAGQEAAITGSDCRPAHGAGT